MNDLEQSTKFSWIRVFIVVAVIVVVGYSFLAPRVGSRRAPMMLQNLNNLFQFGIAFTSYATANEGRLPDGRASDVHQSWRLMLCAALDRSDIARAYRTDAAWDAPENRDFTNQWIPVMTSPYRPKPRVDSQGRGYADYGLISGPGTVNPPDGPVTLDFISEHDGLGTTLLVGECSGLQLIWTEPRDPDVSRHTMKIGVVTSSQPNSNCLLSTYSSKGVCVLFADGSAKSLNTQMHPVALKAITTVDGGEDLTGNNCD